MAFKDFLLRTLTGRDQQQLEDDVSLGKAYPYYGKMASDRSDLDKAKHAYASGLISQKYGPLVSGAAGFMKELTDSLPGGTGFDWQDLAANQSGILRSQEMEAKKPRTASNSFLSFLG